MIICADQEAVAPTLWIHPRSVLTFSSSENSIKFAQSTLGVDDLRKFDIQQLCFDTQGDNGEEVAGGGSVKGEYTLIDKV